MTGSEGSSNGTAIGAAYVYRRPSLPGPLGHRAETWPPWVALADVRVAGGAVVLDDPETGSPFAECRLPAGFPLSPAVEPCVDSSRFFALLVRDTETGRLAPLGIGFGTREEATRFRAAIVDAANSIGEVAAQDSGLRRGDGCGSAASTRREGDGRLDELQGPPAVSPLTVRRPTQDVPASALPRAVAGLASAGPPPASAPGTPTASAAAWGALGSAFASSPGAAGSRAASGSCSPRGRDDSLERASRDSSRAPLSRLSSREASLASQDASPLSSTQASPSSAASVPFSPATPLGSAPFPALRLQAQGPILTGARPSQRGRRGLTKCFSLLVDGAGGVAAGLSEPPSPASVASNGSPCASLGRSLDDSMPVGSFDKEDAPVAERALAKLSLREGSQ